jgi:hypothetical protein
MTDPSAFIPGRTPPRRGLHPALWAVLGAVVALLLAGGAYVLTRPGGVKGGDPDRTQAIHLCEDSIRNQIRSPASAQFSGETYSAGASTWTVYGNIDAQNGFGALIRKTWSCTLVKSGGTLSVAVATLNDN